ncbi:UDP-N-acetylglucosamine transferase subunit [Rhizina undulata]
MFPLLSAPAVILFLAFLRFLYITPSIHPTAAPKRNAGKKPHLLILLGSGGHTAEMLRLLESIDTTKYRHRTYVFSSGDLLSPAKAREFEERLALDPRIPKKFTLVEIPRARKVGQSWLTTPFSCMKCIHGSVKTFLGEQGYPDVAVCNGPGTAVMLVLVGFLLRFFGFCDTRSVYVESFARVRTLSLSGKLLYPFVDRFLVQWPELTDKYARAEYRGILV